MENISIELQVSYMSLIWATYFLYKTIVYGHIEGIS